ncbi:tail fiber assembly protein [Salmonella enterica subsp. salamae]|nr:tail fiber assembly protein [Salmonella enterica subsp. salamae]ECJ2281381.1 tail fiber assembly protein [Salmonella enterica subsp. salamae]
MGIINIWNYLADTKKLIGKSNANDENLPDYCTPIEPPEVPDGKEAIFDDVNNVWNIQDIKPKMPSNIITVYGYMPDTMIYTGSADAISGDIPPNFTEVSPTAEPDTGFVLTFDIQEQVWKESEDHRGETVYSTLDATPVNITNPGPYPDNSTTLAPDVPFPVWSGDSWVTDTAAQDAANTQENIRVYRGLMNAVVLAQCPLTSAVALGDVLTDAQKNTLEGLQKYATELAKFVQSANLTINPLHFPVVDPGLLDYPVSQNEL